MKLFKDIEIWIKVFTTYASGLRKGRVYIARELAIGDVFWAEPVIRSLAAITPEVIVITKVPEVFENHPAKNVIFKGYEGKVYKRLLRLLRFVQSKQLVDLDMAYESRPQMHFLHAYQLQAGLPLKNEYPKVYLSDDEKMMFGSLGPYIALHIETVAPRNHRNAYGINWQQAIDYINSRGLKVVYIGKNKPPFSNVLHFETTLRQALSLIYNAAFFIGLDSGPSHFAAGLRIPSIIFFGSINPWYRHFKELYNGFIMQQPCEHQNCWHEVKDTKSGGACKLVGDEGIPKCSLHTTPMLLEKVDILISRLPGIKAEVNLTV